MESAKAALICFSEFGVNLIMEENCARKYVAEICKLVNYLEFLSIDNVESNIGLSWSELV